MCFRKSEERNSTVGHRMHIRFQVTSSASSDIQPLEERRKGGRRRREGRGEGRK